MDLDSLRKKFKEFVGGDRYRKFVRTFNNRAADGCSYNRQRLLSWQEKLWAEFVDVMNREAVSGIKFDELFTVCDVHDEPLIKSTTRRGERSEVRDTPEYDAALGREFPYSLRQYSVCRKCIEAREKWIMENPDIAKILIRQTTYEEFVKQRLGFQAIRQLESMMMERAAEINALLSPGDELWEWDRGGWHKLAGAAGLAIVRDGQIVQEWCEIKS